MDPIGSAIAFVGAKLTAGAPALSAMQSLLGSIALLLGGAWAFRRYVVEREPTPKANVSHNVSAWRCSNEHWLLRVNIRIANCARVLFEAETCEVRVYTLSPMPADLAESVRAGNPAMHENCRELDWPKLTERTEGWQRLVIEPREIDEAPYDFAVPWSVERVLVYSHIGKPAAGRSLIGWNTYTVIERPRSDQDPSEKGRAAGRQEDVGVCSTDQAGTTAPSARPEKDGQVETSARVA